MMGKGWKSYAVAALMAVVAVLHAKGLIDDGTRSTIETILVGAGLAALRHGIQTSSTPQG